MEPIETGILTLYPYGAAVALFLGIGVILSHRRAADPEAKKTVELFWLAALPLGLILARLVWAVCSLDMIEDVFWETVAAFPGGGYVFFGAVLGGVCAAGITCRVTGKSFGKASDALAAPFLLFGLGCVLADGLIGTGYGWEVGDWFDAENGMSLIALQEPGIFAGFPFAIRDPFYGNANWAVFVPVAVALAFGLWREEKLPAGGPGNRMVFSLSLYAAVRVLYESMRQDDIPKWGFVRCNQVFAAVLLLILFFFCARRAWKAEALRLRGLILLVLLMAAGVVMCWEMEFALEKKISILEWMTMDLCYLASAAGCSLMFLGVNILRKKAFGRIPPEGRPRG